MPLTLGYFCLKRFRRWTAAGAFSIALATGHGGPHPGGDAVGSVTTLAPTHVGRAPRHRGPAREHGPCRLPVDRAVPVPPEVAARRRQKAYEKAQKSGRTPTRAHLQWCDWTILVTNCSTELLTWKEVVVLYRTRWQIELLFKLWKSHNRLATHAESQSVAWQMAEFWAKLILAPTPWLRECGRPETAPPGRKGRPTQPWRTKAWALRKLIGVILQHWLLLTMTWLDSRRSSEESRHGAARLDHRAAGSTGRCRSALRRLEPNASRDRGRGPGQCPEEKAELVPTP